MVEPVAAIKYVAAKKNRPLKFKNNIFKINLILWADCGDFGSRILDMDMLKRHKSKKVILVPKSAHIFQKPSKVHNLFSRSPNSSPPTTSTPRRFISSILGGDVPYGSRGHVLTSAQRKVYPPEISKPLLDAPAAPPTEYDKKSETPEKEQQHEEEEEVESSDEDDNKLIVDEKPIVPEEEPLSLRTKSTPPPPEKRPLPAPLPESPVPSPSSQTSTSPSLSSSARDRPAVRCSVIQRVQRRESQTEKEAELLKWSFAEPEQEQPIDYHVPKASNNDEEDEKRDHRERHLREARKRRAILAAQHAFSMRKLRGILVGAAGHGRTSTSTGGQIGQGSTGGQNHQTGSSGGFNFTSLSGGGSNTSGSGNVSGGGSTGGSGGMGGRDGRSTYGPNSPPTGSLPPFYESLKGGNTGNGNNSSNTYNSNTGYHHIQGHSTTGGYNHIMNSNNNFQDIGGGGGSVGGGTPSGGGGTNGGESKYSMFNNNAFGLVLKDEPDFDYESKMDVLNGNFSNLSQNGFSAYDIVNDAMIADIAAAAVGAGPGGVVDPLQFTATLTTFASPDVLDSLSDAVDLSAFLQRLPNEASSPSPGQVDLELNSTPSITPDSVSITPVETTLESFRESIMQHMHHPQQSATAATTTAQSLSFEHQRFLPNTTKIYQQQHTTPPPPSYQLHMQQQQHHQHHHQQQQQQQHHQQTQQHHPSQTQQQHHHYQGLNHHHNHHHQIYHHYGSDNSNISLPSPVSSNGGQTNGGSVTSSASNNNVVVQHGLDSPPDAKPLIQSVSFEFCFNSGSNDDADDTDTPPPTNNNLATVLSGTIVDGGGGSGTTSTSGSYKMRHSLRSNRNLMTPSPPPAINTNLSKEQNIQFLQQRLGLPPEVQIEFVNGGHGIKNPLAVENLHGHRIREDDKKYSGGGMKPGAVNSCDEDPSKFVCRICSKTFSLQRLLNRHMKCHSDIKRYLCTFCGKGFNDTFDLKRHTRTHTGVRPYKCNFCEKSFTQRCSLESHCLKVHGQQHQYAYKERRAKMYVCEECGHTTSEPEVHYLHLKENHPYSPALLKFYDKRHFKFTNSTFANNLLGQLPMPVHN